MQLLKQHIEALIFTAEQPITSDEIMACLKSVYGWELKKDQLQEIIQQLKEKFLDEDSAFELIEIADGYQFLTKKEYHTVVNTLLQIKARKRLSTAALETLAIIAYKQPLSKSEIEHIRGVNCDYSIQKLLEKELIIIQGKGDGPGRPLLYGTSKNFMDHFGLRSVKELPKLKDLHIADNEIGSPADLMDEEDIPVDLPDGVILQTEDNEELNSDEISSSDEEIVANDEEIGQDDSENTTNSEVDDTLEQDLQKGDTQTEP